METVSRFLLTFLLNAGWQIALITAIAALCSWLLRQTTARYRHILWVVALGLSLCLPILTCSQIISDAIFDRVPTRHIAASNPVDAFRSSSGGIAPDNIAQSSTLFSPDIPTGLERGNRPVQINKNIALTIVALYLLLILYRGIRLSRAWRRTIAIRRDAYSLDIVDSAGTHERLMTVVGRCQRLTNVDRVRILWSRSVAMPITVGNIDPLVILPEQLLHEQDTDVLTSAVGHELVHISRCDYLFNLIYEFIYMLLAFHPVMVLIRRNINQTRELGCDELVTEKLLTPQKYARSLVHLAGSVLPTGHSPTTMTVGINDADILEQRVMTMLKKPNTTVRRKSLLFVAMLLCLTVPCIAAVPLALRVGINSPVSKAQNQQMTESSAKQKAETDAIVNKLRQEQIRAEINRNQLPETISPQSENARRDEAAKENRQREIEATRFRQEQEIRDREPKKIRDSAYAEQDLVREESLDKMKRDIEFQTLTDAQRKEFEEANRVDRQSRVRHQVELAKLAKISMQEAVRIATNRQPGTVMECSLGKERDAIFYRVLIVSGDENEMASTRVVIDATSGQIIKAARE